LLSWLYRAICQYLQMHLLSNDRNFTESLREKICRSDLGSISGKYMTYQPQGNIRSSTFKESFLGINPDLIARDLTEKGYFSHPAALSEETLRSIEDDATKIRFSLNRNEVGGVYAERQFYLTHMLAVSKAFYDYCTHPKIFEVCRNYLGDQFRLQALRYYETYGGHHMQWHTDNKTDKGFAHIPGVIFIVYVSDVQDGEFQYVEGSHKWSGETAYSDYSDELIDSKYASLVRSFKLPRGSILIYNTYGIHRARPVKSKDFVRKSLFFQVDREIERSEPIIVNTEYLDNVDSTVSMYLGFGRQAGYEVFPNTHLSSLRMSKALASDILKWLAYRTMRSAYDLLPSRPRQMVKRMLRG
jgi:hypothetical protein